MFLSLMATLFLLLPMKCFGIWDGSADTAGEFSNVVKVAFKYKGLEDYIIFWRPKKKTPFCTGTVIGDYTILTASHCTSKAQKSYDLEVEIKNIRLKVDKIIAPREYEINYKKWRKLYNKFLRFQKYADKHDPYFQQKLSAFEKQSRLAFMHLTSFDIALIRTKEKIPTSIPRTRINFAPQNFGEQIYAVGFGHVGYSQIRRAYIYPKLPNYRLEQLSNIQHNCLEVFSRSIEDKITTMGDSGAPLITHEGHEQIGVLGGTVNYSQKTSSVFADLGKLRTFIQKYSL